MSELPSNVVSQATLSRAIMSAPKPTRRALSAVAMAASLVLVAGLSACSATPDAVKPDLLYGDTAAADTPEGTKGFPKLVDTPDKRPDATSAKDQKAIADSLAADRNTARDNDNALKSGKEPLAAKPSAAAQKAAAYAAENEPASSPVAVASAAAPQAAPKPAPAPAPVAAVAHQVAPVATRVAAAPAPLRAPESVAQATAPVQPSHDMVAMADTTAPTADSAPALEYRPLLVNGVIPMPPRGGHKTYAEVKSQLFGGEDEDTAAPAEEEPAAETKADVDAPVSAAPTKKVIVKPVSGNEP